MSFQPTKRGKKVLQRKEEEAGWLPEHRAMGWGQLDKTQGRGRNKQADKLLSSNVFCPNGKARTKTDKVTEQGNLQHFFFSTNPTNSKPNMEISQGVDVHFSC